MRWHKRSVAEGDSYYPRERMTRECSECGWTAWAVVDLRYAGLRKHALAHLDRATTEHQRYECPHRIVLVPIDDGSWPLRAYRMMRASEKA
jgi:hypothetical protein